MLKLNNICLSNGVTADLILKENNHYIVIGSNGVGKSTFFKSILGLIKLKSGSIFYNNQNLSRITTKKRAELLSYMPQSFEPKIFIRVIDFVLIGSLKSGASLFIKYDKQQIDRAYKILADLKIERLATRDICTLSGGELTLVSLARVLMQNSKFIFLDEVEAGLDFKYLSIYHTSLQKLLKQHAIVEVSHNLNYYLNLSDTTKFIVFFNNKAQVYKKSDLTSEFLSDVYSTKIQIRNLDEYQVAFFEDN